MVKRMSQLRAILVAIVCTTLATKNRRLQKLTLYLILFVILTLGFSISDTKNTAINLSIGIPPLPGDTIMECGYVPQPILFDAPDITFSENIKSANTCGNEAIIERIWTFTDTVNMIPVVHTQIIEVVDNTPPVFVCVPLDTLIDCGTSLNRPIVTAYDICNYGEPIKPWINEIHYDNDSVDIDEFIEIAGPGGYDLNGHSIVLYDGDSAALSPYDTILLDGIIPNERGCNFGALHFSVVGIQNGDPDGIAFVNDTTVVSFISYGGVFTADSGIAAGMETIDIGVAEPGVIGTSLQLVGNGLVGEDFTWSGPNFSSPGQLNAGQNFEGEITAVYLGETLLSAGDCPYEKTIGRVWSAFDGCGNVIRDTQIITIQDTIAPILLTKDITVDLDDDGMVVLDPRLIDNGSSDQCNSDLIFNVEPSILDCSAMSGVTVQFTATDSCGNETVSTSRVTVRDVSPPVFTNCPGDVTITLAPGACRMPFDFEPLVEDVCDNVPVVTQLTGPLPGSELEKNTTTIYEYEAIDGNGNRSVCRFTVSVQEFGASQNSLACNAQIQITLDTNCQAVVTPELLLKGRYGCIEDFSVDLYYDGSPLQPVPTSPKLTNNELRRNIIARVTDVETGLFCDTRIFVEDKFIPSIQCRSYTVKCTDDIEPIYGGTIDLPLPRGLSVSYDSMAFSYIPSNGLAFTISAFIVDGFDPCGLAQLTYEDIEIDFDCADTSKVVFRNWTIADEAGNSATCQDTIFIERATVSDAVAPPNFDNLGQPALKCEDRCPANLPDCGTDILGWNIIQLGQGYDAFVGHPAPWDDFYPCNGSLRCEGTGMPTGFDCGDINLTFTDTRFDDCSAGSSNSCFRILRRWSLFDWCNGSMEIISQNIEVSDNQGPIISGLTNDTIITDVFDCESIWDAQIPVLQDNCSSNPLTYNIESSSGQVVFSNGVYRITNLALGTHAVRYIATDCCGNESITQILVTVVDEVPPVPVCDQSTVVGLSFSANSNLFGITKIFARTFDNGSYDNCGGPVYFKAIRLDEIDANENRIVGESVVEGDWSSITCDGSNGDDDLRNSPAFYQSSQSYFDDYVDLCCNDIDQGPVTIVLRVFDVDPDPYTFGRQFPQLLPAGANPDDYNGVLPEFMLPGGPLYHHYSDCEIEVIVQDRVAPLVVAPPDITVTCDFWFAFDPDRPNDYKNELDSVFGKIGNVIDPRLRDSIYVRDRVCPAHPKFSEYAPANNFDDPCYDDQYAVFWGTDGYVIDNCEASLEQNISADMNCNRGRIVRSWQAVDGRGNWSNTQSQNITIIDCKEFYVPTTCWRSTTSDVASCDLENNVYKTKLIEWPCDVTISSCLASGTSAFLPDNLIGVSTEDRRPRFDDDNCSMIAATYTDEVFVLVDSACQNILRAWHVIDWCLYDDFRLRNYNGAYQWFYRQLIRLENTTGPVFGNCNDQTICGFGDPSSPPINPCSGTVVLDPEISDDCTRLEDLRIHYKIDFDNDGVDDELGYSTNQGSQYPFPNPNNLPVRAFDAVNYARSDLFSVGTHRILWNAEDGCGNSNTCQYLFTIEDCKPPTALCETGISTIPMPQVAGGFIDIWASDFDLNSLDNCTSSSDLVFSFSDNINDQTIRRTCDDVTDSIEYLSIYVWDEANNFSTCVVGLFISDCDLQFLASLSGVIYTEENEMVNEVMVMLSGDTTGQMMTATDGFYQFADLNTQEDYRLIPEKDTDPLNGVSTYDLVLISQHILDVMPIASPYKMIAADINKDGRVTAFDMVQLRKLILYVDLDFSDNTSWRFVPADFVFIDPLNPFAFPFPEIYTIDSLSANWSADFVGIKIGDVDNSVNPNRLLGSEDRNTTGTQWLSAVEKELIAGQTYHSEIRADQLNQIKGLQYTLKGDENKIKLLSVTPTVDAISERSFGQRFLDQNILTMSWNGSLDHSEEVVLFNLEFEALQNCKLSDVLSISDEYTVAEAYTLDDELLDVSLKVKKNLSDNSMISLFQNQPNPFRQSTLIQFYLPENMEASVEIFDVAGRSVKTIKKQWQKGTHEIDVDRSMLGSNGVYYYTLSAKDKQLTQKMILID